MATIRRQSFCHPPTGKRFSCSRLMKHSSGKSCLRGSLPFLLASSTMKRASTRRTGLSPSSSTTVSAVSKTLPLNSVHASLRLSWRQSSLQTAAAPSIRLGSQRTPLKCFPFPLPLPTIFGAAAGGAGDAALYPAASGAPAIRTFSCFTEYSSPLTLTMRKKPCALMSARTTDRLWPFRTLYRFPPFHKNTSENSGSGLAVITVDGKCAWRFAFLTVPV
mmetsp:Transcript_164245/g.315528  ORF Transcript_164245/g.315528 Transcript_164245/m.315528 type:complete len:219 (-) Transcript_164245:223-879(-)